MKNLNEGKTFWDIYSQKLEREKKQNEKYEQGYRDRTIEVAKVLKGYKEENEFISKCTGLSLEEAEKL